jgi:hypothetical protein
MTSQTVVVRDSELTPAVVEGQAVVLSLRAGSYFEFNVVGTEIWNMLVQPRSVGQIFDELSRAFDVDMKAVERDVRPFLQHLIRHGLLHVIESGEAQ